MGDGVEMKRKIVTPGNRDEVMAKRELALKKAEVTEAVMQITVRWRPWATSNVQRAQPDTLDIDTLLAEVFLDPTRGETAFGLPEDCDPADDDTLLGRLL